MESHMGVLDIFLEDINDGLTISRMVRDSVIKGMVNAIEQEAAEKISQKELEVARLKEALRFYCLGVDENESSGSSAAHHEEFEGRLEQERHLLLASMEEKDKLMLEAAAALAENNEQFELASQELNNLRDHTNQQQLLISESRKELDQVKGNLVEVLKHIDSYNLEMYELNTKLDLAMEELREADEERNMLRTIAQEKQNTLSLVEAKENEHKKKMGVLVHILSKKITKFECKVVEDTKRNDLRLENLSSQLSSLIQKANTLKRQGLLDKQRLERKFSDLQLAEAEVDLLGDQVDTLLRLLEKIYIALDHYSPILQHYPGIMEILKIVRRELCGEYIRSM